MWDRVFYSFAVRFGWGPDVVAELTLPQILAYQGQIASTPAEAPAMGGGRLSGPAAPSAFPDAPKKDVTPQFVQAFKDMRAATGKTEFKIGDIMTTLRRQGDVS